LSDSDSNSDSNRDDAVVVVVSRRSLFLKNEVVEYDVAVDDKKASVNGTNRTDESSSGPATISNSSSSSSLLDIFCLKVKITYST
jgi:hypothetical protein